MKDHNVKTTTWLAIGRSPASLADEYDQVKVTCFNYTQEYTAKGFIRKKMPAETV